MHVGEEAKDGTLDVIADHASQLGSSPISGIHTWWDRPWLDTPHATIVGRLCQWVFPKKDAGESWSGPIGSEQSDSRQSASEHYYQIVVSASRTLPRGNTGELERLVQEDLRAVFPRVTDAKT